MEPRTNSIVIPVADVASIKNADVDGGAIVELVATETSEGEQLHQNIYVDHDTVIHVKGGYVILEM